MIDMIFTAHVIQDYVCEQNHDLYIVCIDLTNVFDTVTQEIL